MQQQTAEVCVWGDFACFTRPEMKVERVSYEVMTPSAAKGILEAIFWKPEFQWRVREIAVMKPIRHFSILRNEVKHRATYATGLRHIERGEGHYIEDDRTQRHTLCLRDVAYRIVATVDVQHGVMESEAKYREQFQRRVKRGQCYTMPYLGCREFTAFFAPEFPHEMELRIVPEAELGRMLLRMDYAEGEEGRAQPRFFSARIESGILRVPGED